MNRLLSASRVRILLVVLSLAPRRTAEGLSKKEIIRCLKRYVAREVFRVIVAERELARAA
jgi:transposase